MLEQNSPTLAEQLHHHFSSFTPDKTTFPNLVQFLPPGRGRSQGKILHPQTPIHSTEDKGQSHSGPALCPVLGWLAARPPPAALSSHLSVVLGWSQRALLRAAAEDVLAEHMSCDAELHEHSCGSRTSSVQAAQSTCNRKYQTRYLLRSAPACALATITSASSKVRAECDCSHIILQARVSLVQSPPASVGSVVLWMNLVTPATPHLQYHPFICKDFSPLVRQNCPEQFKQVNRVI